MNCIRSMFRRTRRIIMITVIIAVSLVLISGGNEATDNYTYAAISKQPVMTQIETIKSSKSYQNEYFKIVTPKDEKHVIYVSGKVNKDVKRLYLRVKKHGNSDPCIRVLITPNLKGEFHIKINTKQGNKKVPVVLNKKGTVTKASGSKYTQPGRKAVPKMTQGIYHLYISGAINKSDANISKSNWYKKSLGGSEGYIYKEGLLQIKEGQNNNPKLIKYQSVIDNNNAIRNAYNKKSYHIDSYEGAHVRYKDPYLKDLNLVLYDPEKRVYEPLNDSQVDYISKIADNVTKGANTDYQKAVRIYEYVSSNFYYDNLAFKKHKNQYANPYKLLYNLRNKVKSKYSVNGKVATTCQGYAGLVAALVRAEGIPARIVGGRHIHQTGTIWSDLTIKDLNTITHYWVEIYINGKWTFVDARSGTRNAWSRSDFNDRGSWEKKSVINYAHFDPMPEQTSNSFIYLKILPGSKDGKYINRKNEVTKLQDFLDTKSKTGLTNGKNLNANYSSKSFATWGNNKENNFKTDGDGQVSRIVWPSSRLYGELDLSGFNKLTTLSIYSNDIKQLDLAGCDELKSVKASNNNLTKFDSTSSDNTSVINLKGNKLTESKFRHNDKTITIKSTNGRSFEMTYNKTSDKVLTIIASKPTSGYRYLGIYDINGKCLTKDRTYSFDPKTTSYVVKYDKPVMVLSAAEVSNEKKGVSAAVELAGLKSLGMHKKTEYFFPMDKDVPDILFKFIDFLGVTKTYVDTSINGRQFDLKFEGMYLSSSDTAKLIATPMERGRYDEALKEMSSYLTSSSFDEYDSYIILPYGMYLQIGNKKLSLKNKGELKVDKVVVNSENKYGIKDSFKLSTGLEYDTQITAYIPKGTTFRMGKSALEFKETTVIKVNGMPSATLKSLSSSLSDFRSALNDDNVMSDLDVDIYTVDIGAENATKIESFLDMDAITTSNISNAETIIAQAKSVYGVLNDQKKAELKGKVAIAENQLAKMKEAAAMMEKSVSGQAVKFTAASSKTNYANIIATWKSVSGAKYQVKLYRNGKLIATKNTSSLKYSFNGYKRGYEYTVEITPYVTIDSENYYGKIVSAAKGVPHKAPTISVKTSGKYKTIKAADRDSTGYQIYISKDKKFKKGVKKITVNTGEKALSKKITTNKNFKKGTNYVKVRAYTKYNNKTIYGTWSSAASVVYHTAPSITVKKSGKNRTITATDQDSTGYQIYISKNKNFNKGTQKIKVKTYSKALNKKLSTSKYFGKSKRYVKVRAYTNVKKNTVVYGPWSKIKTVR